MVKAALRSLGHLRSCRADVDEGGRTTNQSDSHSSAVERFQAAREERDRRASQFDAASGSSQELPAFTQLQAAVEQFAARAAWLKWIERNYCNVALERQA
jgi:hypothetical protein